jgi:PAS domain S-box-containing protein
MARIGLPANEYMEETALFSIAIQGNSPFLIEDAAIDPRFSSDPLVLHEPHIRFYAGFPIQSADGPQKGVLSIMGQRPRSLKSEQLETLQALAHQAARLLELREQQEQSKRNLMQLDQANAQLMRSAEDLENLQRVAAIGTWELEPDTSRLHWSSEVYRIFGLSPSEFDGTLHAFISLVHPDDRPEVMAAQERALYEGEPLDIEHRAIRPDGKVIHVRERGQLIRHNVSLATRLAGTVQEVTQYKELEAQHDVLLDREQAAAKEAAEARNYFRALFESAPGNYLVLTPDDYRMVAASDARLRVTMTRREDILGKKLFDVFPDDPQDANATGVVNLRTSLERVKARRETDVMPVQRYPIRRPDSEGGGFVERYWTPVNSPVLNQDGSIAFIIHRVEDVTDYILAQQQGQPSPDRQKWMATEADVVLHSLELKHMAESLRQSEQRFRSAFENSLAAFAICDLNGRFIEVNQRTADITGYARAELVGMSTSDLIHPDDRGRNVRLMTQLLDGEIDNFKMVTKIFQKKGSIVWLKRYVTLIRENGANPAHFSCLMVDITQEKAAQERLQQSEALLRIAEDLAKVGGWSVDIPSGKMNWSDQVCAIHEIAPGTQDSVEEGIGYYAPEYQGIIRAAFNDCVKYGVPYDLELEIMTAKGRRTWVRTMGEAERDSDGRTIRVRGAFLDISERKRNEQALQAALERNSNILNSISDGFCAFDSNWRMTYVNEQAARLLQKPHYELQDHIVWDVFPESVNTSFYHNYLRTARERKKIVFDDYYAPLNAWFEVHVYPSPSGDGVVIYFQDITERRTREERLRLLETCVERLNAHVLISKVIDPRMLDEASLAFVYANQSFYQRTGYTPAELLGMTPQLLQGPETGQAERNRIKAALQRRQPALVELINYTKSGEPYWIELDLAPVMDAHGQNTHWVSIARDITERRQVEAKLREQATLLDQANDGIIVRSLDNRILYWNQAAERLYGWQAREVLGRSITDVLYPRETQNFEQALATVMKQGDFSGRIIQMHKNGSRVTVNARWVLVKNDDDSPRSILAINTDISDRLDLEERLLQSQKLESLGKLTGGIAHDFNNLLTVIIGNAETLREELGGSPELAELAQMVESAGEKGAELTNRLLAFARRQALEPKPVGPDDIIAGMRGLLGRTLGENITLRIIRPQSAWLAFIDPVQFESAILNLCINARDAMPHGGSLIIEVDNTVLNKEDARTPDEVEPGEYVVVAVSDTGSGMSAETVAHAFDPFYTTKPPGSGSGLGLSMVYGFIRQSKGHIKICSELGRGTTVRIYLPRALSHRPDEPDSSPWEPEAVGNEHILLVEDDDAVRSHGTNVLTALGYQVRAARDAQEAMLLLQQGVACDLLFTDVVMPGAMNGPQLAAAANRLRPGLPVLFASGYTESGIIHHGYVDPEVHLLHKPYRRRTLAAKVRTALDGKPWKGKDDG